MEHSPFQQALAHGPGRLVEALAVWGLPPTHTPQTGLFRRPSALAPTLLYHHPPEFRVPDRLDQFVAPFGVSTQPFTRNTPLAPDPVSVYTTFLNTDDPLFVVCFACQELLRFPSDLIQPTEIAQIYAVQPHVTLRIYALFTRCPAISALTRAFAEFHRLDFSLKFAWLDQIYLKVSPPTPNFAYASNPERLRDALEHVMRLDTPLLPAEGIAEHAVIRMFSAVKIHGILAMLSALLLNISVIVVGKTLPIITDSVFGVLSLLEPFKWEGVVLPLIPPSLSEFLENPVPCLLGCTLPDQPVHVSGFVSPVEQFGIFESVERRFINSETRFNLIPFYEDVFEALCALSDQYLPAVLARQKYGERVEQIEREGREMEFADKVRAVLKEKLYDRITGGVRRWCDEHPSVSLKEFQEKYPASLPIACKGFFTEFVMAQHFVVWWVKNKLGPIE